MSTTGSCGLQKPDKADYLFQQLYDGEMAAGCGFFLLYGYDTDIRACTERARGTPPGKIKFSHTQIEVPVLKYYWPARLRNELMYLGSASIKGSGRAVQKVRTSSCNMPTTPLTAVVFLRVGHYRECNSL